ncbi:hypothetical protein OWV82_001952 [Melia azedarach]|uniref:Uncharacterized protein n=1 Tax=Melia azedarach TaxID=155640 RepID=A0ACC1Z0X9_MELAZ|nr:hypothetical protein OWV82_001952 [Melia azedarach]
MATHFVTAGTTKQSKKISPLTYISPPPRQRNMETGNLQQHVVNINECSMSKGENRKKMKQKQRARELPRLGFWWMRASISCILGKAKAFYNELCCDYCDTDTYNNNTTTTLILNHEQVMAVDPYFSIPVIPPPTLL